MVRDIRASFGGGGGGRDELTDLTLSISVGGGGLISSAPAVDALSGRFGRSVVTVNLLAKIFPGV